MDKTKMDQKIKEMLHECADELHAPDTMKTRVQFALNSTPVKPHRHWCRRLVAAAAVAAIAVTGAFAAGGMGSIFGHGWANQRMDLEKTQAHMTDAGVALTLPDTIGDFTFDYGSDVDTTAQNDMGETEKVAEVDAAYVKGDVRLDLYAHESYTVFGEDEQDSPIPFETAEINGVVLTFRDAHYRFVPPDYQPSDEEKQQEASGALVISYGSDKVEDQTYQSVQWEQDGVSYLIGGFDTGLTAQEMFDLAAELL